MSFPYLFQSNVGEITGNGSKKIRKLVNRLRGGEGLSMGSIALPALRRGVPRSPFGAKKMVTK